MGCELPLSERTDRLITLHAVAQKEKGRDGDQRWMGSKLYRRSPKNFVVPGILLPAGGH
jgi:hypothetical protein